MIKYLVLLFPLAFVTSCTSLRSIQNTCEENTEGFSALVHCLNTQVEEQDYRTDSFDEEYLLMAQTLQEDLNAGKISETKAQAELKHLYNQIVLNRARLQAIQGTRVPQQIDCRVVSDRYVNCRTY